MVVFIFVYEKKKKLDKSTFSAQQEIGISTTYNTFKHVCRHTSLGYRNEERKKSLLL